MNYTILPPSNRIVIIKIFVINSLVHSYSWPPLSSHSSYWRSRELHANCTFKPQGWLFVVIMHKYFFLFHKGEEFHLNSTNWECPATVKSPYRQFRLQAIGTVAGNTLHLNKENVRGYCCECESVSTVTIFYYSSQNV